MFIYEIVEVICVLTYNKLWWNVEKNSENMLRHDKKEANTIIIKMYLFAHKNVPLLHKVVFFLQHFFSKRKSSNQSKSREFSLFLSFFCSVVNKFHQATPLKSLAEHLMTYLSFRILSECCCTVYQSEQGVFEYYT